MVREAKDVLRERAVSSNGDGQSNFFAFKNSTWKKASKEVGSGPAVCQKLGEKTRMHCTDDFLHFSIGCASKKFKSLSAMRNHAACVTGPRTDGPRMLGRM